MDLFSVEQELIHLQHHVLIDERFEQQQVPLSVEFVMAELFTLGEVTLGVHDEGTGSDGLALPMFVCSLRIRGSEEQPLIAAGRTALIAVLRCLIDGISAAAKDARTGLADIEEYLAS
jgi:hypothetical protein